MSVLKSSRTLLATLALALASTGCSSSGPAFSRISPIPSGKGVVYVYRSPNFAGSGVYGTVKANDVPLTKIKNGGYFPYVAQPGPVKFSVTTEATNTADVTVKEGEEKYLKTTIGMGFFVGHLKFTEVAPDIGFNEAQRCKLLPPLQAP